MKYLITFILSFSGLLPCNAQHLKLCLNLTRGNTYYISGTSNTAIVQTINGQENKITSELTYKIAFKVLAITDSVYKMEVRYQTLDMLINVGGKVIEMDSKKNDKTDIPSGITAAMMNKPFTILLTKSGRVKAIDNVEKMIFGVFYSFPQIDPVKKEQIKDQFLQSFGGNAFKGNLEMETAIFPETTVVKNKKWIVNTKLESMVKANIRTVYSLSGIKNGYYQIHGEGKMVTEKGSKPIQINGMPVLYDLSGISTVDIKTDKTTGWVIESKLKQKMKGNIEILDNSKVPGGAKVPMTINTDVTTIDK